LLALVGFVGLYVGIIVYPTPLFDHAASYDGFRVYSDEPIPADFAGVIEDALRRIEAMDPTFPTAGHRVYLCNSQKKYAFFALLLRKSPESLATVLSVPNELFVSLTRVRLFAEMNRGQLRHTRFEGNLSEVIAHEIAHLGSQAALGYSAHNSLPWWKSEGWAEYQANLAPIQADPTYDLRKRIDLLFDDSPWAGRPPVARSQWESQLLVEFLSGVKGYGLTDLIRDDVTLPSARQEMMEWYRNQPEPPS